MINKLSVLLGTIAFLFADCALANAIVTSSAGTVTVQTGTLPARPLRTGDEVKQGDTVATGPASSAVLKFDDGQVAALTANSRMTVTTYSYNRTSNTGSVLLSLINGGMRAITGLIGRASPQNVTYRAATATIGIRGTDVTIATALGNVVVTVTEGAISFTFAGQTITVPAGQGVNARTDGTFQQRAAAEIVSQLAQQPGGQELIAAIQGVAGLTSAIQQAAPGTPRSGDAPTPPGTDTSTTPTPGGPTGGSGGGAGGGTGSPS